MAFTRSPIFRLVVAVTILTLPVAAYAADLVGKPSGGGAAIDWQLNISGYDSIELTVLGPDGESWVKKFSAGRTPSFRVLDLGNDLADGSYNYLLRVNPKVSADLRKKLDAARNAGDEAAARKLIREAGLVAPEQSGGFTVRNGSIVSPDEVESVSNATTSRPITTDAVRPPRLTPSTEDQVIADDLIVQGSLCVGFDCVNGESFGFDTIRLKENNTRIKFEDTSVGTFPTTDWQLTANDSASGGQNKLSIEDITGSTVPFTVEGTASTNSIYVDSTGRIGFRTSTPVLDLHVSTSNTPALRLEQTSAGGFTAQTWDIAGNEANFFVRDVTGGSRLPFRIRPGAPTSSVDISADGDVGIGTGSPNANTKADFSDSTQLKARLALTGQEFFQAANTSTDGVAIMLGVNRTNNRQLWFGDTAAMTQNSTNRVLRIIPTAGEVSSIATDGSTAKPLLLNVAGGFVGVATNAPTFPLQVGDAAAGDGNGAHVTTGGVWTDGSSRAFKQDIADLNSADAKAAVEGLKPVRYKYKSEPNEEYVGFIAEDVPNLVAIEGRQYLAPMDIVATLTKVVQDQQKTIDELAKKVEQLEKSQ